VRFGNCPRQTPFVRLAQTNAPPSYAPLAFPRGKGETTKTKKENQRKIMNNPKTKKDTDQSVLRGTRRGFLALLPGMAVAPLACLRAKGDKDNDQGTTKLRWDLIHLSNDNPPVLSAGGVDSAKAGDGSQITLTGSGTWLSASGRGEPQAVTGGGTWETVDSTGASTGSGNYEVTGLVAFDEVPGARPAVGANDVIGDPFDSRAGLLILRIVYSDGEEGVLTVSCHGGGPPPAAPNTVFEGITTTKGFVGYVDRGKPSPGVDANRTAFHVLHHGGDQD
jgi:hypothetical protein